MNTFVARAKRDRYVHLLSRPARRADALDRLNHCFDYDARFAHAVAAHLDVLDLLRSKGAPDVCHVIADAHDLDGKDVALEAAVRQLAGHNFGYVIVCHPEKLAYYQPEAPAQAILLEK